MVTGKNVKLTLVRRGAPHIEVQLGIFPSKDAALPEFTKLIAREDTLQVTIAPVEGEPSEDNFASYQQSPHPNEDSH